jgi:hypothetical protein
MIAMRAVKPFGDPGPELINPPYQEAADESDQDDVDDEIYECVHGDLGSLRIVFGRLCGSWWFRMLQIRLSVGLAVL